MSVDHRGVGVGRIRPDPTKERFMRCFADRLAAILAAALAMGCNPGTPDAPHLPPKGPARPSLNAQLDPRGDARAVLKKKQKEPGLGKAIPKANTRPNPAL
jgi:hypothetical protein